LRTEHVPMHLEQAATRGVQEQVDRFGLGDGVVAPEGQRIYAIEREIIAAADQCLQLGDDPRTPGSSLLDLGHLAFEERVLDGAHRMPIIAPYASGGNPAYRRLVIRVLPPPRQTRRTPRSPPTAPPRPRRRAARRARRRWPAGRRYGRCRRRR